MVSSEVINAAQSVSVEMVMYDEVERSGSGLFEDTTPVFTQRNRGKLRDMLARLDVTHTEIRTRYS
jgi:hypothetical protein